MDFMTVVVLFYVVWLVESSCQVWTIGGLELGVKDFNIANKVRI